MNDINTSFIPCLLIISVAFAAGWFLYAEWQFQKDKKTRREEVRENIKRLTKELQERYKHE